MHNVENLTKLIKENKLSFSECLLEVTKIIEMIAMMVIVRINNDSGLLQIKKLKKISLADLQSPQKCNSFVDELTQKLYSNKTTHEKEVFVSIFRCITGNINFEKFIGP